MLIPIPPETSEESRQKLRELILYLADRLQGDVYFGAIKLNKIILKADQLSFIRTGKSITGTPYMRLQKGLVPYHMKQILEQMKEEREIAIRDRQLFQYVQKRVYALRNANLDFFSARDIAIIEEVISWCEGVDGSTMSHLSHGTAWKVAEDRQIVPESAFLLSDNQEVSDADIEQGYALIEKFGWDVWVEA